MNNPISIIDPLNILNLYLQPKKHKFADSAGVSSLSFQSPFCDEFRFPISFLWFRFITRNINDIMRYDAGIRNINDGNISTPISNDNNICFIGSLLNIDTTNNVNNNTNNNTHNASNINTCNNGSSMDIDGLNDALNDSNIITRDIVDINMNIRGTNNGINSVNNSLNDALNISNGSLDAAKIVFE